MNKVYRTGAVGALLDEYENVISALQDVIADVSDHTLAAVADTATTDPNCRSIQSVLAHVISSAYSYAVYIQRGSRDSVPGVADTLRTTATAYIQSLTDAFAFTVNVFGQIQDSELEALDPARKIATRWGQVYDIEQLMEHAIVHVMRHRRQIEKFKLVFASR
ncbi:DinB family protein [Chitinophaga polysaccharea]|uniref:DinB family protein n=1 Tax=Chitinophaga TaxID=79328 RepID=UPI001455CE25|nr:MULTISPECIES: DinB family protein [Chitinophaga]NLR57783.1 DinB family protein [Chitinophaga polysaccharea]NLU93377.1 DinB family protein [Chitinophaga sp. Ak27]